MPPQRLFRLDPIAASYTSASLSAADREASVSTNPDDDESGYSGQRPPILTSRKQSTMARLLADPGEEDKDDDDDPCSGLVAS